MSRGILTINAGSSSIKFALFPLTAPLPEKAALYGQIDGLGAASAKLVAKNQSGQTVGNEALPANINHADAFDHLLKWLSAHEAGWQLVAIGHRVVHGGEHFSKPIRLTDEMITELASLTPLAPLHQPHNVAGIRALQALMPEVPQVACFDTAFHRTQPEIAQLFGLPRALTQEGIRRYGFHGLSYEFIAHALPRYTSHAKGRVVVAHLGNGASMAAMVNGQCVATTLGFSTIDGLIMGTRCGALDPGVMLHLMETKGMGAKELTKLLYKESGLLGISGISQDMRTLLASDAPEAAQAVSLFCYRIARELGSLAAAAGGLDALVFTGGIGEHAAEVRRQVCEASHWLGVTLNAEANQTGEILINAPDASVTVAVIPTNEEWMIANHAAALLAL